MADKFDVVIFDKATKQIVAVPGENLYLTGHQNGHPSAQDVFQERSKSIDKKNYDLDIVEAGLFRKGDQYK